MFPAASVRRCCTFLDRRDAQFVRVHFVRVHFVSCSGLMELMGARAILMLQLKSLWFCFLPLLPLLSFSLTVYLPAGLAAHVTQ